MCMAHAYYQGGQGNEQYLQVVPGCWALDSGKEPQGGGRRQAALGCRALSSGSDISGRWGWCPESLAVTVAGYVHSQEGKGNGWHWVVGPSLV